MGHQCEPSLERLEVIKVRLEVERPGDVDKKLFAINTQIKRKKAESKKAEKAG